MWNSKPKKRSHGCSKRKRGQPKVSKGICHDPAEYRLAVSERIDGGRLEQVWLHAARCGIDLDDVED